jgi:hypothetical protein
LENKGGQKNGDTHLEDSEDSEPVPILLAALRQPAYNPRGAAHPEPLFQDLNRPMASQLTCPHCGNILRTTASVAPGRSVKCPACGESFKATADDESSSARGARGARPGRKPGGVVLALLLPGCALVAVIGGIALLAAFVWPGFLRPTNVPPQHIDDPMALVPADSNWVIGADLDRLRAQGVLEPMLSLLTNPPPGVPGNAFPAGMADVVRDGESLLIAGTAGDNQAKPVIVLTTRGPVDVETVKRACIARVAQKMHGHAVYRTEMGKAGPDKKGSLGWLAFPGERLVLLSEAQEKDFAALLAAAAEPRPHPSAERIVEAKKTPLWGVLTFDARMKVKLNETLANEMAGVVPLLQKAHSATFVMENPEKATSLKGQLDVNCGNDADAAELAAAAQKYWDAKKGQLALVAALLSLQDPALGGLVGDLSRTIKIEAKGPRAVVGLEITEKTLQKLQKRKK